MRCPPHPLSSHERTVTLGFMNPLTPTVKPRLIRSFLTFDSRDRRVTIHWNAVDQYFTVVLFVFHFSPVCKFGKFVNFGLGTVRSKGVEYKWDYTRMTNITNRMSGANMLLIPPSLALIFRHRFVKVCPADFVTFLACTHCVAIPNIVSPTRFTSAVKQTNATKSPVNPFTLQ